MPIILFLGGASLNKIVETLTNDEKRVLKRLDAVKGKASISTIADEGLSAVAINRAALGLESKGLIIISDIINEKVDVTRAGMSLIEQVPEREIVARIMESDSLSGYIDELGLDKQLAGIAIGWLRKRKWAIIEKEDGRVKVTLTDKAVEDVSSPSLIQEALKRISDAPTYANDIGPEVVQTLKSRKAISIKEERERVITLTDSGSAISSMEMEIKDAVTTLTAELLRNRKWCECEFKSFDVSLPVKRKYGGKRQPYLAFLEELKTNLVALGFQEMRGSMIETEFWNFDALFQPQNHPARDWTDTYRLISPKKGHLPPQDAVDAVRGSHESSWKYEWDPEKAKNLMPRAHGTCLSARQLYKGVEMPGKYFSVARCFRPDVLDKTHLIEFNQIEGIICDPSLNFRNLLGILKQFSKEIAGAEDVRFYPDYYPFTEPSVQMSAKHPELGWVEFGGAGMFRRELTDPLGVTDPVIAWGLGVDRLAMFKLGIDDIRFLFSDDIDWLRNEEML